MSDYERWGHVKPPTEGPWTGYLNSDFSGDRPLSDEAVSLRAAGLSFPKFGAPGQAVLRWVVAERMRKSGSKYRPPGRDKVQAALTELREKGYYAVRKESTGKRSGNQGPQWATVLSFSNVPWKHIEELNALTAEEVWWHFRRMKASTAHLAKLMAASKSGAGSVTSRKSA